MRIWVPLRMPMICAKTESPPKERKQEANTAPRGRVLASEQPLVTSRQPSSSARASEAQGSREEIS